MNREEAVKKYMQDNFPKGCSKVSVIKGRKAFLAAWDAIEAQQSPTDAVLFINWVTKNNYKEGNDGKWFNPLLRSSERYTPTELYKLFNPSGAAPQAEGWAVGDKAMDNMLRDEQSLASAPQAGPVWVKASERLPLHKAHWNTGKLDAYSGEFPIRFKDRYYLANIYDEHKSGEPEGKYSIEFDGEHHFEEWFPLIEWLDESGQQAFTREQVCQIALAMGNHFQDIPTVQQMMAYMNAHYPEKQ